MIGVAWAWWRWRTDGLLHVISLAQTSDPLSLFCQTVCGCTLLTGELVDSSLGPRCQGCRRIMRETR